MKTATVTDFRRKMREHLTEVRNDQDILVLTGPRKMDFVVLTLEAFNAMEETAHLLSTFANSRRLMESIAQDKAGRTVVKDIGGFERPVRGTKAKATRKSSAAKRSGK